MFKKSRTTRIMFLGILFLVIAAAVTTLFYFGPFSKAQAAPPLDDTYLDPQHPDSTYRVCTIDDIYVHTTYIHVKCTTPDPAPTVYYYAYNGDAANSLTANRYLVLLNTALALNKQVHFRYSDLAFIPPSWCPSTTCRILDGLWIKP